MEARGHQFGNVAVFGDRHPDHRPLRHGRVVLVPLECAGILPDLSTDKDQRYNRQAKQQFALDRIFVRTT
jgi:hypothetical protein